MLNSNHLYQVFKKGRYEETVNEQYLPHNFFDIALAQLKATYPRHVVARETYIHNDVSVSGFTITTPMGKLVRLAVVNTSTSLKEKSYIKATHFSLFAQLSGYACVPVDALFINAKYTLSNNENVFGVKDVSDKVDLYYQSVSDAFAVMPTLTPVSESDNEANTAQNILPKPFKKPLKEFLSDREHCGVHQVPSYLLNDLQRVVRTAHMTGETHCNGGGLIADFHTLCDITKPIHLLDFETVQFVVPQWDGVRPYQQVPFQYSCHKLQGQQLTHCEFLELRKDPRRMLAEQLINDLGSEGVVLAYNARFERDVIRDLANTFADLKELLLAITQRLVDLLPLFKAYYYNPVQNGSWSLKALLPAIMGRNPYDDLSGTANGEDAVKTYFQVMDGELDTETASSDLKAYCSLDTLALFYLVKFIIRLESQSGKLTK